MLEIHILKRLEKWFSAIRGLSRFPRIFDIFENFWEDHPWVHTNPTVIDQFASSSRSRDIDAYIQTDGRTEWKQLKSDHPPNIFLLCNPSARNLFEALARRKPSRNLVENTNTRQNSLDLCRENFSVLIDFWLFTPAERTWPCCDVTMSWNETLLNFLIVSDWSSNWINWGFFKIYFKLLRFLLHNPIDIPITYYTGYKGLIIRHILKTCTIPHEKIKCLLTSPRWCT